MPLELIRKQECNWELLGYRCSRFSCTFLAKKKTWPYIYIYIIPKHSVNLTEVLILRHFIQRLSVIVDKPPIVPYVKLPTEDRTIYKHSRLYKQFALYEKSNATWTSIPTYVSFYLSSKASKTLPSSNSASPTRAIIRPLRLDALAKGDTIPLSPR